MGALAIHWCGDAGPPPPTIVRADGAGIVGLRGQAGRDAARRAIRAALRSALASHAGVEPARVALHAEPGAAPWARIDDDGAGRRVHLAISHEEPLSVAAFRFGGPVGIDLMRVAGFPDWQGVARDYLGAETAAALAALPAGGRAAAFARAWSAHEARLKCLGLGLAEWDDALAARLAACRCQPLALPDGYVGFLALGPAPGPSSGAVRT